MTMKMVGTMFAKRLLAMIVLNVGYIVCDCLTIGGSALA